MPRQNYGPVLDGPGPLMVWRYRSIASKRIMETRFPRIVSNIFSGPLTDPKRQSDAFSVSRRGGEVGINISTGGLRLLIEARFGRVAECGRDNDTRSEHWW